MRFTLALSIFIVFLIINVETRSSGSRSSRSTSSRSSRRGGGSCDTEEECRDLGIGLGVGLGSVLLIVIGVLIYHNCRGKTKTRSTPWRSNSSFVNWGCPTFFTKADYSKFPSGSWGSRVYREYMWRGPHRVSLNFDINSDLVTGSGSDDLGTFTVDGNYSAKRRRIAFTQTYKTDSGLEGTPVVGKKIIVHLTWHTRLNKFVGKWHDSVSYIKSDGDYELSSDSSQIPSFSEKI